MFVCLGTAVGVQEKPHQQLDPCFGGDEAGQYIQAGSSLIE